MFKALGVLAVSMVGGALLLTLLEPGALPTLRPTLLAGHNSDVHAAEVTLICTAQRDPDRGPAAEVHIDPNGVVLQRELTPREGGRIVVRLDLDPAMDTLTVAQFTTLQTVLEYYRDVHGMRRVALASEHPLIPDLGAQLNNLKQPAP